MEDEDYLRQTQMITTNSGRPIPVSNARLNTPKYMNPDKKTGNIRLNSCYFTQNQVMNIICNIKTRDKFIAVIYLPDAINWSWLPRSTIFPPSKNRISSACMSEVSR